MKPQKPNGDGNGPGSVGRGRSIVDKGNDRFGQHVEHDRKGDGDQEGDAHGARRFIVNFLRIAESEAVADGRYETHGHGRRENRSQIDERYGHAREVPE